MLECTVESIVFQSPDTGYTVLRVLQKGSSGMATVVGNMADAVAGSELRAEGEWVMDPRYGRQFKAQRWSESIPATEHGLIKYLGSGLIKGIGPHYAEQIVKTFGTDTIHVIENEPERLLTVPGLGPTRRERIEKSWQQQKEIKNIMLFLQNYDISTGLAVKVYKEYGNDAIKIIRENPFRMADDIWGVGFRTADAAAKKLGIASDAQIRLKAGLLYTLNELSTQGHVFSTTVKLLAEGSKLLEVPYDKLSAALDLAVADESVILEDNAVYLPAMYSAETGAARRLRALASGPAVRIPDTILNQAIHSADIEYDEIQQLAIRTAASSSVMILTGGPGTGKTTTTRAVIDMLTRCGLKVRLAAPTGRAAKRMSEASGLEAVTIHRLLEYKPSGGYSRNQQNPIDGDALIVDECSMIDIILANALLRAVPRGMRLILVGDVDQLPSVGPGNVLRDIIDSGQFPVVRLTKIFRQAQGSQIITNAHRVNRGIMPDLQRRPDGDFFFIEEEDPEKAAETILGLVKTRLPAKYGFRPQDIQVLSPMKKGPVGTDQLNLSLQQSLNPSGPALVRGGRIYRLGDKVMQLRNNYTKNVFNGDIGFITGADQEDGEIRVNFDGREVSYSSTELDELVLSYACTIHKSQGSEYPAVVMPVTKQHLLMLQRNLLYTGITRAKKLLVIVGTKKALGICVHNNQVTQRNSRLLDRLQGLEPNQINGQLQLPFFFAPEGTHAALQADV